MNKHLDPTMEQRRPSRSTTDSSNNVNTTHIFNKDGKPSASTASGSSNPPSSSSNTWRAIPVSWTYQQSQHNTLDLSAKSTHTVTRPNP